MKWSQKIIDDATQLIFLEMDTGHHQMYFALLTERDDEKKLKAALDEGGKIDLKTFGEIVDSNFGALTPDKRQELEKRYAA